MTRMNPSAIGFDLGETLIGYEGVGLNWRSHYPQVLAAVGKVCGRSISATDLAAAELILLRYNTREHPRLTKVSGEKIFTEILDAWGVSSQECLRGTLDSFFSYFQRKAFRYPDVDPCLQQLRKSPVRLGILTDVPYGMPARFVHEDLSSAGLGGMFDSVLTSVEVGHRKPHGDGFRELAKALGTTPEKVMYVGNELKDIEGACAAGLIAVLVDRERTGVNYGQQFTIGTLAELSQLV